MLKPCLPVCARPSGSSQVGVGRPLTNHLCLTDDLGPLVDEDPSHFRSKFDHFDHLDWMRTVYSRLSHAKSRSEPIKHYQSNYAGKFPLWVVADTLDFVDISKLYAGISSDDQRSVAEGLKSTGALTLLPAGQSERVFGTLVVMARLLRGVSPGTTWPDKVLELLKESFLSNPLVNAASLGIPRNWDQSTS